MTSVTSAATSVPEVGMSGLFELAVQGLESMYDPAQRLFCHRLRETEKGLIREGVSYRYTMMTLLGLQWAQASGLRTSHDIEAAVDELTSRCQWLDNIGDLGLLLWLCAATSPKHLHRFSARFSVAQGLHRYSHARRRSTMELAWLLTGLVRAQETDSSLDVAGLAKTVYRLLRDNQGSHGLFGHVATWKSLAGVVRGRVGSFADQVYPIIAMADFSRVCDDREAGENALRCGNAICRLQGPLGQWWWHYNSLTGRVIENYPVYSVHQHAMAPMALFAVQDACGVDFREHIRRGLGWIDGNNEVNQDFKDRSANVIWRALAVPRASLLFRRTGLLGAQPATRRADSFYTVRECRPYELGWLLYALAGRDLQSPVSAPGFPAGELGTRLDNSRYVIVTPVRDEAKTIAGVIASVSSQTVRPVEWVIVNDGSTDGTDGIVKQHLVNFPWIRLIERSNRGFRKSGAGVIEAFYDGYHALRCRDWDFIVKLDGDITLAPDYFEKCFAHFRRDLRLGVGGGDVYHEIAGRQKLENNPRFHVRGATKIYRRACWEAIGGLCEAPGWDTIDEVKANMLGWRSYSFSDLRVVHHRPTGTADGALRDRAKHGLACYLSGYHPLFVVASCVSRLIKKPYFAGSFAIAYGFLKGYCLRLPRASDRRLIRYMRAQQLRRLCGLETIWR